GAGTLILTSTTGGLAGVYVNNNGWLERIYEFKKLSTKETLLLQPGKYLLIYRTHDKRAAEFTRAVDFEIISGQYTTLRL
ncbi:MAG TPA: hypothetical protein VNJ07_03935, partial [Chitinophagales bacterium]|nr:hypothetical protein [Chitinophagales bacterium]